ncbi:pimeloyl-ACP methyl ester carboxylesterase [Kribbella steppae]|uniref:Pimeloyl-ACP methyl ester carboxylesterase n=1 Tax=Kribbella steppae TaxID=2512223 RepID=A0A4V2S068_9ACTN|nr:alpha/beta hydrolase [Kribbella steppae]TCO30446.1 pimeloyl-ACP methyl ester carboxylesterase [Kribbella steppae]
MSRLPDGRLAQYWHGGATDGVPVFFLHGCPDTRHAAYAGDAAARRAGVRLIAVNRPGYGLSDVCASTHLSVADDVAAVADLLGIERYAVLGMSIGGPYALACAVRHPGRVTAVGVVASPAVVPELDPPYLRDDLGPDQQGFFTRLAGLTPDEAVELMRPDFESYVDQLNPGDPDDAALARRFLAQLDPRDAELTTRGGPTIDGRILGSDSAIAAAVREALANSDGYLRDAAISFRGWDFRPEQIECRTFLWYGALDANASIRNGRWLAERIPHATLVIREQTTHLAVLHDHWDDILTALTAGN